MARNDEGPLNPYAAPDAPLEAAPSSMFPGMAEKEALRRKFLTHEASVKSLGSLYILGGAFYLLATIIIAVASIQDAGGGAWLGAVLTGAMGALFLAVGLGLTSLRSWARWITTALTMISLISILFVLAVAGYQIATIGLNGLPDCRFTIGETVQPSIRRLVSGLLAWKGNW